MQHPGLRQKLADMEYERRHALVNLQHLLCLIPVLVFGALVLIVNGTVPLLVIAFTLGTLAVVAFATEGLWRREHLSEMRRAGLIDEAYRPPGF